MGAVAHTTTGMVASWADVGDLALDLPRMLYVPDADALMAAELAGLQPSLAANRERNANGLDVVECQVCQRPVLHTSFDAHRLICSTLPRREEGEEEDGLRRAKSPTGEKKRKANDDGAAAPPDATAAGTRKGAPKVKKKKKTADHAQRAEASDAAGPKAMVARAAGRGKVGGKMAKGRLGATNGPDAADQPPADAAAQTVGVTAMELDDALRQLRRDEASMMRSRWTNLMQCMSQVAARAPRPLAALSPLRAAARRNAVAVSRLVPLPRGDLEETMPAEGSR
mmetsp:Transcript_27546/g.92101  ORF Transcript_27546/g.92101 Transcript_27546/m.92101 type:complete len:283 (-) Transcript_27546:271-1119(-)